MRLFKGKKKLKYTAELFKIVRDPDVPRNTVYLVPGSSIWQYNGEDPRDWLEDETVGGC